MEIVKVKKIVSLFLLFLISSFLFFPITVYGQLNIEDELSLDNESYSLLETLTVNGNSYQIISYQNGDVILIDGQDNLVLDTSTLEEVFTVKGFKDTFIQNGITYSRFESVYLALSNMYDNAELANNLMSWITLGAVIVGVSSIVVGGIALPLIAIVGAVKFATSYIVDNIQYPLNTADNLLESLEDLNQGSVSSEDYFDILSLNEQITDELSDLNSQLLMNIVGFGNVAYYEALYKIANVLEVLSSDNANNLRSQASSIEISQTELEQTLIWLETLNTNSIISEAGSKSDNYISLQNNRIESIKSDFENELNKYNNQLVAAQSEISNQVAKGADISLSNSIIIQADAKITIAENHASEYEYRTATAYLVDASILLQQARDSAIVSLIIHQAEIAISEAQNVINQKSSNGADVTHAVSKLNEAKTSLQNSKSLLTTNTHEATISASKAETYANEAKGLAEIALDPIYTQEDPNTPPPESPSTGLYLSQESILIIILMAIVVIVGIFIISKKGKK